VPVGVRIISLGINLTLGKRPLERPKVKEKIKMDIRDIACDVDNLMAVAVKLRQFAHNL
jgi:hypothetical protein